MEDAITAPPPPSRFFQEDLDNFASPPPPLAAPVVVLPANPSLPTRPSLLLIALSKPSLHLLHHFADKTLVGTLILPECPLSGNSIVPSLINRSCNLYAAGIAVIACVQYAVSPERCRAVVKALLGGIRAERVVVLDSIRSQNFRGRLSADEPLAFKLETAEERADGGVVKGVEYLPSGSVMDGLGAALLAECQLRKVRATLLGTWPENVDPAIVAGAIEGLLPGLKAESGSGSMFRVLPVDSDLYS